MTVSAGSGALRSFLLRGGSRAVLGRVGTLAAAFAIHTLVTRLLPPEAVGTFLLLSSVVVVARMAGQLGLGRTLIRRLGEIDRGNLPRTRPLVAKTIGLAALGGSTIALFLLSPVGGALLRATGGPIDPQLAVLTALWSFALVLEGIVAETFRGLRRVGHAELLNGLLASLLFVATLIVAQAVPGVRAQVDLTWVVTAATTMVAVSVAVGLLRLAAVLRHPSPLAAPSWPSLLTPSLPILATTLIAMLLDALALWLLGATTQDSAQLALYGTAHRLTRLVGMPLLVVNAVLPPVVARLSARGDRTTLTATLRMTATLSASVSLVVAVVLIAFGEPIASTLFGDYYGQAALLIAILTLGQAVVVVSGSCGMALLLTGHQGVHLRINVLTLVTLTLAGAVLAHTHGALGIALASVTATALQQIAYMLAARHHTGVLTAATISPSRARAYWRHVAEA